jgi:hypothetical protein
MGNFREEFSLLKAKVVNRFSELRNANPVIEFLTEKDIENGEWDDYFDVRNDTTGEVYEVTIVKVDEYGIETCKIEDRKISRIGLLDLASLEDQISLVELMEFKVKKS